jgi:hypothetical protein
MASLLGTVWFVGLVGVVCFCAGVYLSDKIKNLLGK